MGSPSAAINWMGDSLWNLGFSLLAEAEVATATDVAANPAATAIRRFVARSVFIAEAGWASKTMQRHSQRSISATDLESVIVGSVQRDVNTA